MDECEEMRVSAQVWGSCTGRREWEIVKMVGREGGKPWEIETAEDKKRRGKTEGPLRYPYCSLCVREVCVNGVRVCVCVVFLFCGWWMVCGWCVGDLRGE